jgi:hypothetical protein
MRILKNGLLLSLLTLFFSCTSSDDTIIVDISAKSSDLVGSWSLIEESQEGRVSTTFNNIPVNGDISSTGKNLNTQLIFTESPNNVTANGSYTDVIKISIVGQSIAEQEVTIPFSDFISQGLWSLNQGILTITQNNVQQEVRISELTASTLKIEIDILDEQVDYQGFSGKVNTTIKMTFTK